MGLIKGIVRLGILFALLITQLVALNGFQWQNYGYFTMQSNALATLFILFVLIASWYNPQLLTQRWIALIHGLVVFCLTITSLVYFILVAPGLDDGFTRPAFLLTHGLTPLLVLVEWLLFWPGKRFQYLDLPLWALYPLGYFILCQVLQTYPYAFMNPLIHGYGTVWLTLVVLIPVLGIVGLVLTIVDRLRAG